MIYLLWHHDYDYAGVSLVEGPDDADIKTLYEEYMVEYKATSDLTRGDGEERWVKYRESSFYKKYLEPSTAPRPTYDFVDNVSLAFSLWLVDKKGFKPVNERRVEV